MLSETPGSVYKVFEEYDRNVIKYQETFRSKREAFNFCGERCYPEPWHKRFQDSDPEREDIATFLLSQNFTYDTVINIGTSKICIFKE